MPHLSPMYWLAAIIMFFFSLFILISILWWHLVPRFPNVLISKSAPSNPWHW